MAKVSRRDALIAAIGSASLLTHDSAARSSDPQGRVLELCSPKDGIVAEISAVATKTHQVGLGDLLIQIDPDDEHQALSRLKVSQELLELEARLLSDEQIGMRRRLVEISIEISNKYLEYAEFKWENEKTQHQLGLVTDVVVKQAEAAVGKARGEREKASIALTTFDFNVEMMKARHAKISSQLPEEIDFIQHKMARLDIHSPVAGKIEFRVAKGSFVKLGRVFAIIS
jgi:multidrug resistance efflux pump